jgi:hypothetical protein
MWSTVGPSWNCFLQHQSPNTIQSGPWIYTRCMSLEVPIKHHRKWTTWSIRSTDRSFSYVSKMERNKSERARSVDSLRRQFTIDLAAQLFPPPVITQSARMVSRTCKDHQQIAPSWGKKGHKSGIAYKDTISNDREKMAVYTWSSSHHIFLELGGGGLQCDLACTSQICKAVCSI